MCFIISIMSEWAFECIYASIHNKIIHFLLYRNNIRPTVICHYFKTVRISLIINDIVLYNMIFQSNSILHFGFDHNFTIAHSM